MNFVFDCSGAQDLLSLISRSYAEGEGARCLLKRQQAAVRIPALWFSLGSLTGSMGFDACARAPYVEMPAPASRGLAAASAACTPAYHPEKLWVGNVSV